MPGFEALSQILGIPMANFGPGMQRSPKQGGGGELILEGSCDLWVGLRFRVRGLGLRV